MFFCFFWFTALLQLGDVYMTASVLFLRAQASLEHLLSSPREGVKVPPEDGSKGFGGLGICLGTSINVSVGVAGHVVCEIAGSWGVLVDGYE